MLRIAQIITATGYVQAVVRPSGTITAPAHMTFVEIGENVPDPTGKYWNGTAFQNTAP